MQAVCFIAKLKIKIIVYQMENNSVYETFDYLIRARDMLIEREFSIHGERVYPHNYIFVIKCKDGLASAFNLSTIIESPTDVICLWTTCKCKIL
jgi:hypothetical protein